MAGKAKKDSGAIPNALIRGDLMRLLSDCVGFLDGDIIRQAAAIAVTRAPKEKCPKINIDDLRAAVPGVLAKAAVELERELRKKEQAHVHRNAS